MRLLLASVLFGFLLLTGGISPTFAQTIADHVVINEVDINPPGNDYYSPIEWVELYNPTSNPIDIGGWSISSNTNAQKSFKVPSGTIIKPEQYLVFSYTSGWFADVGEIVKLHDKNGNQIDQTPIISDTRNDSASWQRVFDGVGSDSSVDWELVQSTIGFSNGKLTVQSEEQKVIVTVVTDQNSYIFDQTAIISGTVSKEVFVTSPSFVAARININISGPNNYEKTINLYPDRNLMYKTQLELRKVLQITEGVYNVTVEYAGTTTSTQFSVGEQLLLPEIKELGLLSIATDSNAYIPGNTVILTAHATEIIPFEGLKYTIRNADGELISDGTLFPNPDEIKRAKERAKARNKAFVNPESQFVTELLLSQTKPVYGTYVVQAQYGPHFDEITFNVSKEQKEASRISLQTDKPAYKPGETVIISGRLNQVWVPTLNLEIKQSTMATREQLEAATEKGTIQQRTPLTQTQLSRAINVQDGIRPTGNGSFEYMFRIPLNDLSFGQYRVTVSENVGSAQVFFDVVLDPESYQTVNDRSIPFFIATDKTVYDISETVFIHGRVNDISQSSQYYTASVKIEIVKEGTGQQIMTFVNKPTGNKPGVAVFTKTAIPDITGAFQQSESLSRAKYDVGNYIIKANYAEGKHRDDVTITIIDTLSEAGIRASFDKPVYGLGETVHLTGTLPTNAQGVDVKLKLYKPNGKIDESSVFTEAGRFSWDWQVPKSEKEARVFNERAALTDSGSVYQTNFGTYRLNIGTNSANVNFYFEVSPNPELVLDTSAPRKDLTVTTEKPSYQAGEKLVILGNAIKREQGNEGLVIPDRVDVKVETTTFPPKTIQTATVNMDAGGNYRAIFDLPTTVYSEGTYKVTAVYLSHRAQNIFEISNVFRVSDQTEIVRTNPVLLIATDKDEYQRGEIVDIVIRPNKNIRLEKISIAIPSQAELESNCTTIAKEFRCGAGVKTEVLNPDSTNSFNYKWKVPTRLDLREGTRAPITLGDETPYVIATSAEIGLFTKTILVNEKPLEDTSEIVDQRIIDKFNRITESFIPITINEKLIGENSYLPKSLQGSLFTPTRGEEANVNLQVSLDDGTCIIGQDTDCLISDLTRVQGSIYQNVTLNGVNYKIRYSGPDAQLEKFTIISGTEGAALLDETFNVIVVKDTQPSRVYYKIAYDLAE